MNTCPKISSCRPSRNQILMVGGGLLLTALGTLNWYRLHNVAASQPLTGRLIKTSVLNQQQVGLAMQQPLATVRVPRIDPRVTELADRYQQLLSRLSGPDQELAHQYMAACMREAELAALIDYKHYYLGWDCAGPVTWLSVDRPFVLWNHTYPEIDAFVSTHTLKELQDLRQAATEVKLALEFTPRWELLDTLRGIDKPELAEQLEGIVTTGFSLPMAPNHPLRELPQLPWQIDMRVEFKRMWDALSLSDQEVVTSYFVRAEAEKEIEALLHLKRVGLERGCQQPSDYKALVQDYPKRIHAYHRQVQWMCARRSPQEMADFLASRTLEEIDSILATTIRHSRLACETPNDLGNYAAALEQLLDECRTLHPDPTNPLMNFPPPYSLEELPFPYPGYGWDN